MASSGRVLGRVPLILSFSPPVRLGELASQLGCICMQMQLGEGTAELSAADVRGFPRPNGERDRGSSRSTQPGFV